MFHKCNIIRSEVVYTLGPLALLYTPMQYYTLESSIIHVKSPGTLLYTLQQYYTHEDNIIHLEPLDIIMVEGSVGVYNVVSSV